MARIAVQVVTSQGRMLVESLARLDSLTQLSMESRTD